MTYIVKTVPDRRTYGWHTTRFCESMTEVETALAWFEKEKTPAVATDSRGLIVGRVIEESKGQFRMWTEPIK